MNKLALLTAILVAGASFCRSQSPVIFGGQAGAAVRCDNCVPLMQCPTLKPAPGRRLTYEQAANIRRSQCGFQGTSVKVCCPEATAEAPSDVKVNTPAETPPSDVKVNTSIPTDLPLRCGQAPDFDRIHGGTDAPLGGNPWMVAIGYEAPTLGGQGTETVFQCGGSLVTAQHVVTAAHCVHRQSIGLLQLAQLNIGDWNTETDPDCTRSPISGRESCGPPVIVRQAAAVTTHPAYNTDGRYNNDVAVIRLDAPVEFGPFVQPICIPHTFDPSLRGDPSSHPLALATGWGVTERGGPSPILQEVRLPLVPLDRCNASYGGILNENQVCAGGVEGEDSCMGDSGGPLITTGHHGPPYQLVGLTSFGRTLCGTSFGVYTSVPAYRDWILRVLPL